MSDLSKRLREELIVTDDHNIVTAPLCAEAADALDAKDAEIARLREALRVLRDLPIVENDNPDTLRLDGVAHTGPAVDYFFRIVRKIKQVARQALS